jgi:hypothetical protein
VLAEEEEAEQGCGHRVEDGEAGLGRGQRAGGERVRGVSSMPAAPVTVSA